MSAGDPLTLSREDLYELVWSKPMLELAKDFGLSDVALAKRCRKLGIPVPGRGYWARVEAGQTPRQPRLRKREDQDRDYSALTFDVPREKVTESDSAPPALAEHAAVHVKIQNIELPGDVDLLRASAVVKRMAVSLKRPWRKEIIWNRGEHRGPTMRLNVSEPAEDRALRICERLAAAADSLGWKFQTPPAPEESRRTYRHEPEPEVPKFGVFMVEGEALSLRVDERQRRIDYVLTESEKAKRRRGVYAYTPRWDYVATGELRVYLSEGDSSYARKTWKDGAKKRVEDDTRAILIAMADEAFRIKADREQQRVWEIERRRQQELELQLSNRRAANTKLVHELEAQAGAWFRAKLLRFYIRAMRREIDDVRLEAKLQDRPVDFIAWAEHYVDQLDPLRKTPHDPDLEEDRPMYRTVGDEVKEAASRMMGLEWQTAWKLRNPDSGTDPTQRVAEDDEY
jgi:hypothetical protein